MTHHPVNYDNVYIKEYARLFPHNDLWKKKQYDIYWTKYEN